jgi:mono/diheme cytochrome c family protein
VLRLLSTVLLLALPLADAHGLGGQNMVLGRMVPARGDAPSVATTTHARAHYVLHCAGCHGFDGSGAQAGQVPDMRRLGQFLRVPGGREFIVSVPGVTGSGLSDEQIAEVTNWLLNGMARGSVPEGTPPYTAAEVRRARSMAPSDVAAARRQLVLEARARGLAID